MRFWNGGQAARALKHAHIVPVHDADLADSRYYIAMEYMAGKSIEDLLHETGKPVPLENTVHYLGQIAGAIDFAHKGGIVHRDIKPSNILLSRDRRNAYLTDFGVAQLTGQTMKTAFGTLIGTPEYMSPEQIEGQQVDARSDIYSLGVTAYHMLTGALPFDGHPATVLYNHVHTTPPPVRRANDRLPADVDRCIAKALAKQPNRRYDSAAAFAGDLRRALRPGPRPAPRTRWGLWAGLLLLAVAIGALALLLPRITAAPPPTIIIAVDVTATPDEGGGIVTPVTSTVAPTLDPTSTTRPEPTVEPTGRPTIAPTAAGETATPPPAATPTAGALRLLSPADGADIPANAGSGQTFSWQWNRPLADDESFELRFFPLDGGPYLAPFGWRRENFADDIDLHNLPAGGYSWVVAVVRGTDGVWEADVTESAPFQLTWGR
jgi:serine/threonine-protein kinase